MPLILKSIVLFSLAAGLIAGCAKEKDVYNIIINQNLEKVNKFF